MISPWISFNHVYLDIRGHKLLILQQSVLRDLHCCYQGRSLLFPSKYMNGLFHPIYIHGILHHHDTKFHSQWWIWKRLDICFKVYRIFVYDILRIRINGRELNDYYLFWVTRFAFVDVTVTSWTSNLWSTNSCWLGWIIIIHPIKIHFKNFL